MAQCVEMSCFVERNNGVILGSRKGNVVSIRAVITGRNVACNITFIARPDSALIKASKLSIINFTCALHNIYKMSA